MEDEIIYHIGVDSAKDKFDAAILLDVEEEQCIFNIFENNQNGFEQFFNWVSEQTSCPYTTLHLSLESTGVYSQKLALAAYEKKMKVSVINPSRIKGFSKSYGLKVKNDRIDAQLIALFGQKMKTTLWKPNEEHYQELKDLLTRIDSLDSHLQAEKNRLEQMMLTIYPSKKIQQSLKRTIRFLEREEERLKGQLKNHLQDRGSLEEDQKLLESIPGVGLVVASWMNAILMHGQAFENARQLAAYIGVTPMEYRSGKSVYKTPHISKHGPGVIRKKLYMATMAAIRYNPDIKLFYEKLIKRGKKKMVALIAAMRKLVHLCFGVIKNQTKFQQLVVGN